MKKRTVSILLAAAMATGSLAGCGGAKNSEGQGAADAPVFGKSWADLAHGHRKVCTCRCMMADKEENIESKTMYQRKQGLSQR